MSKKDKRNINQTYDFDEILEKRNVTSPTPSNVSDELMTTVASIGDTGRVWCPECRKKGIDHEIKETDDLNQHYMRGHSDIPLTGFAWNMPDKTLSIRGKIKDDLRYMRDVNDFKKGGAKWEDVSNKQIKDMIKESYDNSMKMLNSLNTTYKHDLIDLLNLYFKLHNSIGNDDRDLLIHSFEVLHLVGTKKQSIVNHRIAAEEILKKGMLKSVIFDKLSDENKREVLVKTDPLSGGKRRRKRKKTRKKRKKTRKKRKRKSRKRKSKKRRKKK